MFNAGLVQICKEAFKNENLIASLDFSACQTTLREIGHSAFEVSTQNDAFTGTISLPNSLYYIGNKAFYKFRKATGLQLFSDSTAPSCLRIIGYSAFEYLGSEVDTAHKGSVDLVLPDSLKDGKFIEAAPPILNVNGDDKANFNASVGTFAFANSPLIRTVTMQPTNPNTASPGGINTTANTRVGLGYEAFSNCSELLRFKGNKSMMRLGRGVFQKCPKLKELFLSTKLNTGEDLFVWGYGEGRSIFFATSDNGSDAVEYRDLVIYVDGDDAPTRRSRQQKYYIWNSDPKTYVNEYATSSYNNNYAPWENTSGDSRFYRDSVIGRLIVPTYYGIDFHTAGAVKYLNLSTGTLSNEPTNDYSNCVALIKYNSKYIVTKCYAQGLSTIDMTTWNLDADVNMIGSSSFSTLSYGNTTQKIILSNKITTIRDRAFYSVGTDGIDIVTYKDSNNVEVTDNNATNVCFLPSSVTRLEEYAFYNNNFEKVSLPSTLTMLGNTTFTCSPGKQATISSFGFTGNSSNYTIIGQGMIDTSSKTLLYYAANGNGTLNLGGETINAIGARALANTKYTSIILPTSVTTVYGGAFEGNSSLTQISGINGLKYIAGTVSSGDTDVYNNDANFNIHDLPAKDFRKTYEFSTQTKESGVYKGNFANRPFFYRWIDSFGAFAKCPNLDTFNFSLCSSTLKKIGYGAFEGCSKLENMTGGSVTYTYYRYSNFTNSGLTKDTYEQVLLNNPNASKETATSGVLDLSGATNLKTIGKGAFKGCSKLKYAHLPMLEGFDNDVNDQAKFYLGVDKEDVGSWYNEAKNLTVTKNGVFDGTAAASTGAVLVGETAQFASNQGTKYNQDYSEVGNSVDQYDKTKYKVYRYEYLPGTTSYFYVNPNNYSNDVLNDVPENSDTVKYWTYLGSSNNHTYLLFNTRKQVQDYFA